MIATLEERLKEVIRDVPNFPKEGIVFKDITPIFHEIDLCEAMVEQIAANFSDQSIDCVAGIDARGFLLGVPLAMKLGVPFVPVRKSGKLPYDKISTSYSLEYGIQEIEVHTDAFKSDWNVLIHDDLLATGGTAEAAANLINSVAHVVGFSFIINLSFLSGKEKLQQLSEKVDALVDY